MARLLALLLPAVVVSAALGQGLFDCTHEDEFVPEGEVVYTDDCQQLTCSRGELQRKFCDSVPFGCVPVLQRKSARFPGCCPRWCCGSDCQKSRRPRPRPRPAMSGGSGGTLDADSCVHEGRRIGSGQSAAAPDCRRLDCLRGVLTTHFCQEVPAGCTLTRQDTQRQFPDCCPFWRCDNNRSGVRPRLTQGGRQCVHESRHISDGATVSAPGCRKHICSDGVLTTMFCRETPPDCETVSRDLSKPFPGCCPSFRC